MMFANAIVGPLIGTCIGGNWNGRSRRDRTSAWGRTRQSNDSDRLLTVWAGPWGVSYAANLTPDKRTGLGAWTADQFIKTMRTGKHLGVGRPLLPPMPMAAIAALTDADLRALFAWLRSIKAIENQVPQPSPPK